MTQPARGQLIFSADSLVGTSRFPVGTIGTLLTLTVAIADDATVGPAAFNLLASLGTSRTGIYSGDLQELVLTPPPTNAASDLVDGVLTVDDGWTPWHNAENPLDVNGDGLVSTLDALAVINHLNAILQEAALPNVAAGLAAYYDVNNDRLCTPQDVLAVVNHLNAEALSGAEGERSGSAPTPLADSRFVAGPRWAALTSAVVSPGSTSTSAPAGSSSVTAWQTQAPTDGPRTARPAGVELRTAAIGNPSTDTLRDRLLGDLTTELSSLEGVLNELADDIACVWR